MVTQKMIDENETWKDCKIVSKEYFLEKNPLFKVFFDYVNMYGNKIICLEKKDAPNHFYLVFYSQEHIYELVVNENYIGLNSTCRKMEPMEYWRRHADLADGKPTVDTLMKILADIAMMELIRVDVEYND